MSTQGPFSSASPIGAELLKAWEDQAAPWKDFAERMGMGTFDPAQMLAGAPALGLAREHQESAARLVELSRQFQQRYAEFARQNAILMQDAFQVLKKRLETGPPAAKSPAELYDEWIDCAEGAYAQAAHSEAFARLLAELCNISSAFRAERGKLTEHIARHLDMPSRAEVDTLHRQVRALKDALRAAANGRAENGAKTQGATAKGGAARRAAATAAPRKSRRPRAKK